MIAGFHINYDTGENMYFVEQDGCIAEGETPQAAIETLRLMLEILQEEGEA